MCSKINNTEIMMGNESDAMIEKLFEFLWQKHQEGLEEKMRRIEFFFGSVDLLH